MNAIKSIAACAGHTCANDQFNANPYAGMDKQRCKPVKGCATFKPGASNTIDNAGNLPDSEVFSRPELAGMGFPISHGFGRDGFVRKAGRMALSMFETSRPPVARSNAASGFQSHNGAETMTTVNTPTTSNPDAIARQQAIENALSAALDSIRQPSTEKTLWAATGRTRRALSLLKQACTEAKQIGGCHE